MNIRLLNYSAGSFVGNSDIWTKIEDKQDMNINIVSRLRYTSNVDVFGLQFDFIVSYKQELIIKTGFLFGMEVKDFKNYIEDKLPTETNKKNISEIIRFIWPYVVGALAARCSDHSIQLILPDIDFTKFAEEVMMVKN